jgi:hypothetical protein
MSSKRHSLKTLPFGSGLLAPRSTTQSPCPHSGVILQRKDIFYSGSLMKIPTSDAQASQVKLDSLYGPIETSKDEGDTSEFKQVFKTMMDLSILRDPVFLFFAFSNFFTSIGYNVPYIYLVVSQ